jgi:hypothetical protein
MSNLIDNIEDIPPSDLSDVQPINQFSPIDLDSEQHSGSIDDEHLVNVKHLKQLTSRDRQEYRVLTHTITNRPGDRMFVKFFIRSFV